MLKSKLYVMGGAAYDAVSAGYQTVASASAYDPITDSWTSRAPMPSPRGNVSAAWVSLNGQPRIEVIGGAYPRNNIQYIP